MHYVLKQTATFGKWREGLRDPKLKAILASRLDRLAFGLEGDSKRVAPHIYELRIHYGAGIRVYFLRQGNTWIILLQGGDKSSQERDIKAAQKMAEQWSE
ncbi:type II toxin-antitoxin system RelE/ParE family toxin [Aquidulcibacter sp.]|jgi:putative addiction module killer protein|uniref:type II toxin-antitoxin system RelE/ParE family toxin n=1 Tax=Aquidulcibacter sp. TaxID=2052990 RepID=UPI003BA3F0C4